MYYRSHLPRLIAIYIFSLGFSAQVFADDGAAPLDYDVIVAPASDVCSNPSDVSTCTLPSGHSYGNLVEIGPGEKVYIRYEISNPTAVSKYSPHEVFDEGSSVFESDVVLSPGQILYGDRIETAPPTVGATVYDTQWKTKDITTGAEVIESNLYKITRLAADFDFEVFVAPADEVCSNPSSVATCSLPSGHSYGSTLAAIGAGEPVFVQYQYDHAGNIPHLVDHVASRDGLVLYQTPFEASGGNKLNHKEIISAPSAIGNQNYLGLWKAEDLAGNLVQKQDIFTITTIAGDFDFEVFLAPGEEVCSDPSIIGTCSLPSGHSYGSTLAAIGAGEPVFVQYQYDHDGNIPHLVDHKASRDGTVVYQTPFEASGGNRLNHKEVISAQSSIGNQNYVGRWEAEDLGGNVVAKTDVFSITTIPGAFDFDVIVAPADEVCSDPSIIGTCQLPSGHSYGSTLAAIGAGEPVFVKYQYDHDDNIPHLTNHKALRDGTVLYQTSFEASGGNRLNHKELISAPSAIGTQNYLGRWEAEDLGGNAVARNRSFQIITIGGDFVFDVFLAPANVVCSNPNIAGTCALPSGHSYTNSITIGGSEPVFVQYQYDHDDNIPHLTNHVASRDGTVLYQTTFEASGGNRLNHKEILLAPSFVGTTNYLGRWDVEDLGGNPVVRTDIFQITSTTSTGAGIDISIFLSGPLDGSEMSTDLRDNSSIPLSQPYDTSPWDYNGSESVSSIPSGVVDWVLVSLRSNTAASSEFWKRAVFLKSDGSLVDLDGSNLPSVSGVTGGSYYVVVDHRNHLAVMSNAAVAIPSAGSCAGLICFNFTNQSGFGTAAQKLENGVYSLWGGDGTKDNTISAFDFIQVWLPANGSSGGYQYADFDMNNSVSAFDFIQVFLPANGKTGQVPG